MRPPLLSRLAPHSTFIAGIMLAFLGLFAAGFCGAVSWGVGFVYGWCFAVFVALAQAITVYDESWPRNGCYLAMCVDYETAAKSDSPSVLRDSWQGGVDLVFVGLALTICGMLSISTAVMVRILTHIIPSCMPSVRTMINKLTTRRERQPSQRVVSPVQHSSAAATVGLIACGLDTQ